ncbi:sensor histidine kinase/response regulator [Pseudozyma hubeiensis SY62]|uniref:Sensor histidine kinase/response regulator n=1 Tax=Pseudozyma hubeiensis (strain SY62) TaxID=1305764 RepID=R9P0T5_PSEHS|nr:sensor histidine kinase/response regulator [Pseudozyma hubeiensis SY62]GAC94692.1 sensor histidine kinase/response regulator [Pseudozyma hubeiensis SY62]
MQATPSSVRSPTVSQPFIYPMRSAVSIKQPKAEVPSSSQPPDPAIPTARIASRPASADSTKSPPSNPDIIHEGRNRPEDVDKDADRAMAQMKVPGNEDVDLRDHLEQLTTTRFEYVKTDEGHMILTGRGGKLARCEDEPIHIPGAVQSFGCMVVVRISPDGEMIVRQASENSIDILGVSPSYLFSLPTFLDILDEDQADLLWDNIDSLDQSSQDLAESGPTVFQLRGYNMAGYDERIAQGSQRSRWNAWCGAHIPDRRNDGEGELTVVLEFELVDDLDNPISTFSPPTTPLDDRDRESGNGPGLGLAAGWNRPAAAASSGAESPSISIGTLYSSSSSSTSATARDAGPRRGLEGLAYTPSQDELRESTHAVHKPLKALSRMRRNAEIKSQTRSRRPAVLPSAGGGDGTGGMLDLFGILSQVNDQLAAQKDLNEFLKVLVGIIRDITLFSRVMIYQFDEAWNGQVVCELVDWNDSHDLYRGLHFPATDIPAQARALYKINKVRLLYDRDSPTARMVCRDQADLDFPVDMTHALIRAMSPIHIKYLANMGVRSSMSVSITAFGELWGLISLHNYGAHGKRVSFPIRQLLRLIGESVSSNIERLSYTRRLSARKLINTLPTDQNPSGYIISNAEDLLTLFDADYGVIAVGNEAKILGPLNASQEVLAVTEYLRLKKFEHLVTSQDVRRDFPDMVLSTGLHVIAGLLVVPLSGSGVDFIAFLRKAQLRHVNWAGKPFKEGKEGDAALEPRKSFKVWSETVEGTCRAWKDEELETASVLCLVYGKFISVWRQREQALHYNQLNRLLLSNASHEVRTPLNHIINYLELALDSKLDDDTRENLSKSHIASKSLLFVINDLLDLTKQEIGNELLLQEPFDLAATVREAVEMHEWEAKRRKIDFSVSTDPEVCMVLGDKNRVRQVITNTVTNSVKYTREGQITVTMRKRSDDEREADLPPGCDMEVELVVGDTGEGIPQEKLEVIFREFEQVESVIAQPGRQDALEPEGSESSLVRTEPSDGGLGLGLAIVARVVKNLGGQLRVDSQVGEGTTFTYYIPFCSAETTTPTEMPAVAGSGASGTKRSSDTVSMRRSASIGSGSASSAGKSEIDSLVEAIQQPVLRDQGVIEDATQQRRNADGTSPIYNGPRNVAAGPRPGIASQRTRSFDSGSHFVEGSGIPVRSVKIDPQALDVNDRADRRPPATSAFMSSATTHARPARSSHTSDAESFKAEVEQRARENVPTLDQDTFRLNAGKLRSGQSGAAATTTAAYDNESSDSPVSPRTVAKDDASASHTEATTPESDDTQNANHKEARRGSSSSTAARRRMAVMRGLHKAPGGRSGEKIAPLRVLVVEDDPINRMILKKRLSIDGHTTLLAVNGEEGVRQFEQDAKEIDVILMDLQMPICNGQEACIRIRELERKWAEAGERADRPASQVLNGRVPILAVSATLVPQMRQEMVDIGMDGWLLKPIDFARLGALLKGLLHPEDRAANHWRQGYVWEKGGWLSEPAQRDVVVAVGGQEVSEPSA